MEGPWRQHCGPSLQRGNENLGDGSRSGAATAISAETLRRLIQGAVRSPVFISMHSCVVAVPISFVLRGGRFTKSLYNTLLAHAVRSGRMLLELMTAEFIFSSQLAFEAIRGIADKYNKPRTAFRSPCWPAVDQAQ